MERERPQDVTQLLHLWSAGDQQALDELVPQVMAELKKVARAYMASERTGHTLQPTALINETFLKLVRERVTWQNRAHFFGIAATHMRRILGDYARRRLASKREAGIQVELDDSTFVANWRSPEDLLDFDIALDRISAEHPRCARLAELHYFGGLTADEAAVVMEVSLATAKRDLKKARELLAAELRLSGSAQN